ncbi:MAG: YihY/virulence factor BrkB family protein [Chloroflexi bacterium]|nr:YihY/virulence factor BrkB family protein [Chloroflexota bacterium]
MSETEAEVKAAAAEEEETKSVDAEPRRAVPWRSAWEVVRETVDGMEEYEVAVRAAALAYYGLFSLFPLLLFLVFIASALLQVGDAGAQLEELLARFIPVPEVLELVEGVIDQTVARRSSIGIISALALLWTASTLFANLEASLNVIWGAPRRVVYRRRLLGVGAVLVLGLLFLLAILLSTLQAVPLVTDFIPFMDELDFGISLLLSVLFFWLIYRWLPNAHVEPIPSLAGAALAGLVWQASQFLFRLYLTSGLSNLGAVYGTLASLIGLVLWVFLTGMILFVGGIFSAVLQRKYWD